MIMTEESVLYVETIVAFRLRQSILIDMFRVKILLLPLLL